MRVNAADVRSFTSAARRAQIVAASIATIAERGYAGATFAQIAARAGLSSTRLISYHFAGKDELMAEVVRAVLAEFAGYVRPRVEAATGAAAELRAFVEANLDFIDAHRAHLQALVDIGVNARDPSDPSGPLAHRADVAAADVAALTELLQRGQQAGEFRSFDPAVVAVRGAGSVLTASAAEAAAWVRSCGNTVLRSARAEVPDQRGCDAAGSQ